jgi:hypothetical protein
MPWHLAEVDLRLLTRRVRLRLKPGEHGPSQAGTLRAEKEVVFHLLWISGLHS